MGKTIIKIWGNGCPNCRAMGPIVDGVKGEYSDIEFREINASVDTESANKYEVTTLPTLIFEKDGEIVGRLMGLKPKSLVIKKIQEVF